MSGEPSGPVAQREDELGKGSEQGRCRILFLAGSTGRDPLRDGPCRTPEEERAGKGKVVGGIKEQTRARCWISRVP